MKVWRTIGNLRNARAFKTWLCRIVRNTCTDMIRAKAKSKLVADTPELCDADVRQMTSDPIDALSAEELKSAVQKATMKLSPDTRFILHLKTREGMSSAQIAEIMGCTAEAARMRIHRARIVLRDLLHPYFREET